MVAEGLGGQGGVSSQSTEDFEDSESALCDAVMMDTCHYMFIQTHRTCNTRVTLMSAVGYEWRCRVSAGSSVVTNVPSGGGC